MTEHDPYRRTLAVLIHASHTPMRYRTKAFYRTAVPARDRAYFERAWATLRRGGWLVIDPASPTRYIAG